METPALYASCYLHHLHIASPDPRSLAAFYAKVMKMSAAERDGGWELRGPARRLLLSKGPAKKLLWAAFAVRDAQSLAGLRRYVEARDVPTSASSTPFFADGAFAVKDPDNNVIVFGLAACDQSASEGLRGPLQHLTLATRDVQSIEDFYSGKLGFAVSDRVRNPEGKMMTCFMRGNHEHHNLACFYQERTGIDHHSYEAGEWDTIRDWSDHFATCGIQLKWGPGRHGPGNNLFIFIEDVDGNWIEVSAELEAVQDRPTKEWSHEPRTLNLWGPAVMRA
jgi:catechol 2,3-dioxygenase